MKLSQENTARALAISDFKQAANFLPSKIEQTFEQPKVREMSLAIGREKVIGYIEFELIKLADRINVSGNLTSEQIDFIAKQLFEMYPNESLADFKVCFERAAMGLYGKIFKLDGVEVGQWMKVYLDEKYKVLEDALMRESEDYKKQYTVTDEEAKTITEEIKKQKDKERLQNWLEQVKNTATVKTVRPITEAEIQKEGRLRIQPDAYKPDKVVQIKILIQGEMHKVAMEGYSHLTAFQKADFQVRKVGDYSVNCDSQEDAEMIYHEAKQRIEDQYKL